MESALHKTDPGFQAPALCSQVWRLPVNKLVLCNTNLHPVGDDTVHGIPSQGEGWHSCSCLQDHFAANVPVVAGNVARSDSSRYFG